MTAIIHRQWRPQQADSKYPFADDATLVSSTGRVLPKNMLLDAQLYPIGGTANMYLRSIEVSRDDVTVRIGNDAGDLCSGKFDRYSPPSEIALEDSYKRAAGLLVADPAILSQFQVWEQSKHLFTQESGAFAASVCVPTPEIGLRGLVLEDDTIVTGDVWLVGEHGVVVRYDEAAGAIRFDMVGDPLYLKKECEDQTDQTGGIELFAPKAYLKTINHLPPDAYGDFKITAGSHWAKDTILRIYPQPDGVHVEAVGEKTIP